MAMTLACRAGDPSSILGWGVVPSWYFEGVCFRTASIQVIYNKLESEKNMKIDPYNHKERYLSWKEKNKYGITGLSDSNSELIREYITNMENGVNVATVSVKGSRSHTRLNNLKDKMIFFAKKFKEKFSIDNISDISEEQLCLFFSDMRSGLISRQDGKIYMSVMDYVKAFKAFWHWHQKISKKKGKEILDITVDLDTRSEKPKWVYLTEEQVKKLYENANYKYKVLIMFLFDSGIRSPTELINIKISDLYNDCKELHIRDEISKTFGRRIKLMICPELLKNYVDSLKKDDYLFPINPKIANRYLKRLGERVLGDIKSPAGQKYSELTMYDFRHISCCYWLPRYKSESALKYRFGWKKSDKIHYYSELLGMKDTISEEDLLVDVTKTEIEKRLEKSERGKELMQDKMDRMEEQMKEILKMVDSIRLTPKP